MKANIFDHVFSEEERKQMRFTILSDEPIHTSNEPLIIIKEKQ